MHIVVPLVFAVVPTGHKVHMEDPVEENEPGEHLIQALGSMELILLFAVPAGQSTHITWPVKLLYDPDSQAKQLLSLSLYVPTGQAEHILAPRSE